MSQYILSVLRRIRACEGEAAAQVVLEHFASVKRDEAYDKCKQAIESLEVENPNGLMEEDGYNMALNHAIEAIEALKKGTPTNETGNARPGGE